MIFFPQFQQVAMAYVVVTKATESRATDAFIGLDHCEHKYGHCHG